MCVFLVILGSFHIYYLNLHPVKEAKNKSASLDGALLMCEMNLI